ncbi:MAG: tungstate ABC transporter ATP-binding protein WtpC [Chloroflexota bacterium]|nr:tungstate ABC transporter ATP-binding protein WtpC [Chloroflexota bacterium]
MIKVENVHKNMGEFSLRGVDIDIGEREYLMLLGPTGAGKTILLETIAGIYHPDKGRITVNGRDITGLPPRKRNIGMVYQDYMLFPHLNIEKNIMFGLRSRKVKKADAKSRARELAGMLKIDHLLHRHPGTLSGGEQQRAAIARALIMEPEVLLLDEPLSALDTETRTKLRAELRRIHEATSTTMIHVTHSFDEAFLLGSQMAIMNEGIIVQVGEPGEVFRKPNCKFVADFLGAANLFPGNAIVDNGMSSIDIGGVKIASAVPISGRVYASIRPEDIMVSLRPIESSARNSFEGNIERVEDHGTISQVTVDAGAPFIVSLTRRSFEDMSLAVGSHVFITFKAAEVHAF